MTSIREKLQNKFHSELKICERLQHSASWVDAKTKTETAEKRKSLRQIAFKELIAAKIAKVTSARQSKPKRKKKDENQTSAVEAKDEDDHLL